MCACVRALTRECGPLVRGLLLVLRCAYNHMCAYGIMNIRSFNNGLSLRPNTHACGKPRARTHTHILKFSHTRRHMNACAVVSQCWPCEFECELVGEASVRTRLAVWERTRCVRACMRTHTHTHSQSHVLHILFRAAYSVGGLFWCVCA